MSAVSDAGADAAGPDMSVAKPLPPRLAAKLAKSVEDIQASVPQLVSKWGGGRMEVVDDTFVLVAGEKDAPLDDAVKTVHAATQALWHGLFWHRPARGAAVFVFQHRVAYATFAAKYAPKGSRAQDDLSFYVPDSEHVPGTSEIYFCAEDQGIHGIAHEAAHHLITRGDFPRAPRWISEGVPALLEAADPQPDGDLRLKAHFRLQTLRDALKSGNGDEMWINVNSLFSVTEDSFWYGAGDALGYGISREFLRFLEVRKNHALVPFYRAFREGFLTDPSGEDALTAATGVKDPYDLTAEFRSWILSKDAEQDEP